MMLFFLAELTLGTILIWLVLTQVVFPAIMGLPLFPLFWSRETKLRVKLAALDVLERETALELELKAKAHGVRAADGDLEPILVKGDKK